METKKDREERISKLWKNLDTANKGELDFNGLRKGLRKIDHRQCRATRPHMTIDRRTNSQSQRSKTQMHSYAMSLKR